ncbi:prepilin-type N-terminal cleavage/methylation domain-containing protein [Candidatus Microgenomates bacterium]|nr:prepilin-type N-terminal cleavage/methylation domain-containing protein [Candidatus Microgenomates bacterium]
MKSQRGVTLVELLVATVVIASLVILVMNFLVDKFVANTIANARSDIQLQTQLTLDAINFDIKHAANVDSPNRWEDSYAPAAPANGYSWSSDSGTLVLAVPVHDQGNNILYEDPQVYVSYKNNLIYFVNNRTLYRRRLAAPVVGNTDQSTCPAGTAGCTADAKLAENITGFSLTYYDANDNQVAPTDARSVRVTIAVDKQVFGKQVSLSQSIRTVFRNE